MIDVDVLMTNWQLAMGDNFAWNFMTRAYQSLIPKTPTTLSRTNFAEHGKNKNRIY